MVLVVLAASGLVSLVYLGAIHLAASRERARRRRGEAQHIAARIYAPQQAQAMRDEARLLFRHLHGVVDDQPMALPLMAAILAGALLLILALDPIMDAPMLVPASLAVPGWLKAVWTSALLVLVIGHCVWVFRNAPRYLSRQWLLLHPDGAISARGAALLRFDPARPIRHFEGITLPASDRAAQPGWAPGAVLAQDGQVAGFVYFPAAPAAGDLRPLARTAPGWWRIELAPEHDCFETFLRHHYPPAIRAMAPGWPP